MGSLGLWKVRALLLLHMAMYSLLSSFWIVWKIPPDTQREKTRLGIVLMKVMTHQAPPATPRPTNQVMSCKTALCQTTAIVHAVGADRPEAHRPQPAKALLQFVLCQLGQPCRSSRKPNGVFLPKHLVQSVTSGLACLVRLTACGPARPCNTSCSRNLLPQPLPQNVL